MSEYITIVSYDDNGKDMPCAVCMRQRRDGKQSMCVGYTNDNARELNRIVTEQGYLTEHDKQVRAETIDEFKDKFKCLISMDDCVVDKVAEQLKEKKNE